VSFVESIDHGLMLNHHILKMISPDNISLAFTELLNHIVVNLDQSHHKLFVFLDPRVELFCYFFDFDRSANAMLVLTVFAGTE